MVEDGAEVGVDVRGRREIFPVAKPPFVDPSSRSPDRKTHVVRKNARSAASALRRRAEGEGGTTSMVVKASSTQAP